MGALRIVIGEVPMRIAKRQIRQMVDVCVSSFVAVGLAACSWNCGESKAAETLSSPQPPVRGGTLAVAHDGSVLVLIDRDRARLDRFERNDHTLARSGSVQWTEATRGERAVVVDSDIWVVRADGRLTVLDKSLQERAETFACASPYGLAWDVFHARAWVSCTTGEITIAAREGAVGPLVVRERLLLEADTGDVAIVGKRALVARTRSSEILVLDTSTLAVLRKVVFPLVQTTHREGIRTDAARGALRVVPYGAGVAVLHQRARVGSPLRKRPSDAYSDRTELGGPCGGLAVQTVLTELDMEGAIVRSRTLVGVTYASDVAASAGALAVALPGSFLDGDVSGARVAPNSEEHACLAPTSIGVAGQVSAVTWLPGSDGGSFVWQTREPAALFVRGQRVELDERSARDTGHDIFHAGGEARVPCISCHLDGGDDGHVWEDSTGSQRRTTSLRLRTPSGGGVASTAPFHWDGALTDLDALMAVHFPGPRGTSLRADQTDAFAAWADRLTARPSATPASADQIARGRVLFTSLGCSGCHGAAGQTPVNRPGSEGWQIPSLVELSERAPYGHAGCGQTFAEMLTARCGGPAHHVSDTKQVRELAAYLGVRPQ